jgi:hypothetical protein
MADRCRHLSSPSDRGPAPITKVKSTALSPPDGRIGPIGPILVTTDVAPHRRKMAVAAAAEIRGRNDTTS